VGVLEAAGSSSPAAGRESARSRAGGSPKRGIGDRLDRNEATARAVAREIGGLAVIADVRDGDAVTAAVDAAAEHMAD